MKLGEALIKEGLITRGQLEQALERQVQFRGRIGTNLVELHILGEDELTKFLGSYFKIPPISPDMIASIDEDVLGSLTKEVVEQYKMLPFRKDRKRLHTAMLNPKDTEVIDRLRFVTGYDIIPYVISEMRLIFALEKYYGIKRELRYIMMADRHNAYAEVKEESIDEIKVAFTEVKETEEIAGILIKEAYKRSSRIAVFILQGGKIAGWKGRGISTEGFAIPEEELKRDTHSIFSEVMRSRSYYRGPVLKVKGNEPLIKLLSGTPIDALLMPIQVREKVIALLYVDNGNAAVLNANVNYLSQLVSMASIAFEIVILKNKILKQ